MTDIKYWPPNPLRSTCGAYCLFNVNVGLQETLWKKDPTKKVEKDKSVRWTRNDSRQRGISHETLLKAWQAFETRDDFCDANENSNGCSGGLWPTWFSDQRERIEAILKKRKPSLTRWSLFPGAFENLKKMGVVLISPYPLPIDSTKILASRNFEYFPIDTEFVLRHGNRVVLRIEKSDAEFIEIGSHRNVVGEERNVSILVTHPDKTVSFFVIAQAEVVLRRERVSIESIKDL